MALASLVRTPVPCTHRGHTGTYLTLGGKDDIRQWSPDSILNITQDDDVEENDASLIMVTVGA